MNCTSLNKVETIDGDLKTINDCAFKGCTYLEEIQLSSGVNNIGEEAFCDCTALSKIKYSGTEDEFLNIRFGKNCFSNINKDCDVSVYSDDGTTTKKLSELLPSNLQDIAEE